jgi:hypothetical protein
MRITRNIAILISSAAVGTTFLATPAFAMSAACSNNPAAQHMHAARAGQPPVLPAGLSQMRESVSPLTQLRDAATFKVSVEKITKALRAATVEHAKPEQVARLVKQAKQELDQLAPSAASAPNSAPNSASKAPYQAAVFGQADAISQEIDALKAALDQLVTAVNSQNQLQVAQVVQSIKNTVVNLARALGVSPSITSSSPTSIGSQSMPGISATQQRQPNGALADVPASPTWLGSQSMPDTSTTQQRQPNGALTDAPASPTSIGSQSMPDTSTTQQRQPNGARFNVPVSPASDISQSMPAAND